VRRALEERYRLPAATRINPEEVIATGAALYARSLENGGSADASFKLRDVLSGTLAIELADGSCVPIIRKNQTVPTGRTRVFTTVQDEQLEAEIHLVQGNRSQAWRNRSLGRFVLRDIQRAAQGRARIAVSVDVSDNGIVTVRAGDRHTGASHTMTARARPETQKKPVIGRRADYLRSLTRRAEALQQYADPDLREELDDVVQHARARAGDGSDTDDADDVVTVLEALIREIVIGRTEQATGEGRRAAS
jgi:molecular chaperone DnaK (HSP70)